MPHGDKGSIVLRARDKLGRLKRPGDPKGPPSDLTAAIVKAASLARIGIAVSVTEGGERRFAYVSDVAARLFGREPHEVLTQPTAASLGASYAGIEHWREQRARGEDAPSVIESELERADGSTVSVNIASSNARVDGRDVTIDFLFDTEQRRRAETLERSRTRFRTLLDLAPEGVVIVLPDRIAYANPAVVRLLGYKDVAQITSVPLRAHLHPDDLEAALDHVRQILSGVQPVGPLSLRGRHQQGTYVSIEVVALPVDWEEVRAVLAIVRDLDQRRRLKSQSIQADRLTALGTLAAGVAHEINNPLAYVLLNLQYLLREVPKFTGDPARLQLFVDRLNEARHGTERVSTIVRDLRAFARTEQDTLTAVDLRRVIGSALRVAGPQIEGVARVLESYDPVPPVGGNATRLEQVFLNLIINAAQAFTSSGNPNNEIHVAVRSEGERVISEVSDNGTGIEPELLSRVFDPFFTTKPGVGTGLGLPICHSIVTRMGGEIDVHSSVGKGTTFRVSLPALERSKLEHLPTPQPQRVAVRRARVLVVDDELPLASMLSRVLSDEHEVIIATSAREALEELSSKYFDVVLCDLLMPSMSGMDLYRELRERLPGTEQRMVFMTGGAFTPRAAEFLSTVTNPRLEKPFDLNQVRQLVRKLSRQKPA